MSLRKKRLKTMRSITKKAETTHQHNHRDHHHHPGRFNESGDRVPSSPQERAELKRAGYSQSATDVSRGRECEACGVETRNVIYRQRLFVCKRCYDEDIITERTQSYQGGLHRWE